MKVDWPEYHKFQDEDWFDEEAFIAQGVSTPQALIPEERWKATLPSDSPIDTGAIHDDEPDDDPLTDGDHYIVERLEVHKQRVAVRKDEASTPKEAARVVRDGGGEYLPMQSDSYVKDLMDHEGPVQWRIFDSETTDTGKSVVEASRMTVSALD